MTSSVKLRRGTCYYCCLASLNHGILMCCLLLLKLLECFSNKVWFLSRLCQQILEQEIPGYVCTFTWNAASKSSLQPSTVQWVEIDYKGATFTTFLMNKELLLRHGHIWVHLYTVNPVQCQMVRQVNCEYFISLF